MIGQLIRGAVYLIIILLIFAVLPKSLLDKIKQFFNWNVFVNTLKIGWQNLLNFLKEIGVDFEKINEKIKVLFGFDFNVFWLTLKEFLANFFLKLANIFK